MSIRQPRDTYIAIRQEAYVHSSRY